MNYCNRAIVNVVSNTRCFPAMTSPKVCSYYTVLYYTYYIFECLKSERKIYALLYMMPLNIPTMEPKSSVHAMYTTFPHTRSVEIVIVAD